MFTDKQRLDWLQRAPNPNYNRLVEEWTYAKAGVKSIHVTVRSAFDVLMWLDLYE